MSISRRCPQHILDKFLGSENAKTIARAEAVAWMKEQTKTLEPGDTLLVPNGETGELTEVVFGGRHH